MYIMPKQALEQLPHLGSANTCTFSDGDRRNALGYALYAGGTLGGFVLAGKLSKKSSRPMRAFSQIAGAGAGFLAALYIEMRTDLPCAGL